MARFGVHHLLHLHELAIGQKGEGITFGERPIIVAGHHQQIALLHHVLPMKDRLADKLVVADRFAVRRADEQRLLKSVLEVSVAQSLPESFFGHVVDVGVGLGANSQPGGLIQGVAQRRSISQDARLIRVAHYLGELVLENI